MRSIAVFDFDCTLTRHDTLVPWLVQLAGRRRVAAALVRAMAGFWRARDDRRTGFKGALLEVLVRGRTVEDGRAAAARLAQRLRWRPDLQHRFAEHRRRGDFLVIASGSPRLVLEVVTAGNCRPDALIATELDVVAGSGDGGRMTGRMVGGNCVREEKARRVAAFLERHGPFASSYGYGNLPHDRAMLALLDNRVVVGRQVV